MPPQVAWIGLGNMGRGMCKNLVEKGNLDEPLIIFNRTVKRAEDLKAKLASGKSTVAQSLQEAVTKADILFLCLGDDVAVKDTVAIMLKGEVKGKLFVDCSTIHPDTTTMIAKSIETQSAQFVACPVFGAPAMAEAGQLVCVLAGPSAAVRQVKKYTKGVMGRAEIDFSDQPHGKATLLKVIGNTFILNMVETLSEGHTIAEKSGLGNENLHTFVETMFPGPYTAYSGRMMQGDYHKREEPLFGVDLARKDAKHALSLAEASGVRMKAVEVADSHLADVQQRVGSKGDIAGIYGASYQWSKLGSAGSTPHLKSNGRARKCPEPAGPTRWKRAHGCVRYKSTSPEDINWRQRADPIDKVKRKLLTMLDVSIDMLQDIFLNVLSSAATKREARSYLSRYTPPKPPVAKSRFARHQIGVNLGSLYLPIRSVDESPVFAHSPAKTEFSDSTDGPIHAALVKIKNPQSLEDATLDGVGHTISQLSRLGLNCVVVVDPSDSEPQDAQTSLPNAIEQADRVAQAIDKYGWPGARRLDSVIRTTSFNPEPAASVKVRGPTRVTSRNLILAPLRRGVIPVVAPIAFVTDLQKLLVVKADDIILALTRDLAGIQTNTSYDEEPEKTAERLKLLQSQVSLDRLIILDPLGGIPSTDRANRDHVFINLEQEYDDIRRDLLRPDPNTLQPPHPVASRDNPSQAFTLSNPFSKFVDGKLALTPKPLVYAPGTLKATNLQSHAQNLELLHNVLGLLPPTSSAILTTPQEAASPKSTFSAPSNPPGVGTRRRRNPLIHNLLTDKPVFSSSLPARSSQSQYTASPAVPATFVKRGMPVTIVPDPYLHPWKPPTASAPCIQLSDPQVDLTRLVYLIEDSFNRTLDVPHYLSRISERIAGIIICGNYEGGAILTWEAPFPDCTPEQMVPYLDKFAVLKRSQGAGGVADIVFKAMVGDCFPQGVCWRSRQDNPVNKWYFERSKGTWKMPNTNWTMFWTTDGIETDDERGVFGDYASVCRNVVPSWADRKAIVD